MLKRLFRVLIVCIIIAAVLVYLCDNRIRKNAEGKLFSQTSEIPYNKVGLLLGTSKFLASGSSNPYYDYRINAAVELMKANKIKYLVISGDNGTSSYNEPQAMRDDLVQRGIDSSRLFLDYAGFRTFDSMVRLRDVFGQSSVTVISQPFHNERALYIASKEGIDAIGYNAKDVSGSHGFKVQAREKLARVKLFLDYLTGKQPKFLGKKVIIPA